MKLKTVSVDVEAFRLLRKEKGARESYGDVVRRVFAERTEHHEDPSVHLDELFAEFKGRGILTAEGRARLAGRKQRSPRSPRPARAV